MKFAHFSDVHIGSWRDPRLAEVSTKAFLQSLEECQQENVDFVLISGDLFNVSLPAVDRMKEVAAVFKQLRDKNIGIYVIAGSHDFSPTGKTMLDVLENAGLFTNVMRGNVVDGKLQLAFTTDEKTGAKITGIIGKMGMLDKHYYEALDLSNLEAEPGEKIFMFHTQITEFKPKDLELMESTPLSYFPKGFLYYAGGHPHFVFKELVPEYGLITHPGPMFPNNFREIEKLRHGGYYLVNVVDGKADAEWKPMKIHDVKSVTHDCGGKTADQVNNELEQLLAGENLVNTIITLRFYGQLSAGRISDLAIRQLFDRLYNQGAVFVMKNTAKLETREFQEVKIERASVEDIEEALISEHTGQLASPYANEKEMTKQLMTILSAEKLEGETTFDFEQRLLEDIKRITGES